MGSKEERRSGVQCVQQSLSPWRRVGCGGHGNSYYPRYGDFAGADLRLNEDGTVRANLSLHDHGCGTITAFRMILAETLDLDPNYIELSETDSSVIPYDDGCFSSRITFVVGRAAFEAAEKLKPEILHNAAQLYQMPIQSLYIHKGCVCSKDDPSICYSFGDVSLGSILKLRREVTASVNYYDMTNPGVTGAHFTHVEVDTYTGFTKVLDYLAVHDIGQPINPAMCEAQIQGAAQMG